MDEEDVVLPTIFTRGKPRVYDRRTTIHHWQLRDLVSPAENEHEFYCVYLEDVYLYNTATRETKVIANLEFSANSMTVRNGFLAAGGLHGELEVRDLRAPDILFKGQVGNTVNNALHIGTNAAGEGRLFVCCNDSTIKIYALPAMVCSSVLRCPCPINYAALSPDGTTLVAVGDCEPTLLYKATPTGYAPLSSFTEAADVGMCCAWNQHGTLLASAHQDGIVAVWDARSGCCVARMQLPTAARCVKFGAAPLDMLAVAEHEEAVSLVDARAWSRRQVVTLDPLSSGVEGCPLSPGSSGRGLDISGLAVTPSGGRVFVGLDCCCMSLDIDSTRRRTFGVATIA